MVSFHLQATLGIKLRGPSWKAVTAGAFSYQVTSCLFGSAAAASCLICCACTGFGPHPTAAALVQAQDLSTDGKEVQEARAQLQRLTVALRDKRA